MLSFNELEELKVGDLLYEYFGSHGMKSIVITPPFYNIHGQIEIVCLRISSDGKEILEEKVFYIIDPKHINSAPNIYKKEVYLGITYI